jgi:phospholipase/lecithinase/hemolysin
MKQLRYLVPSVLAAAMLVACGGGTTVPGSGSPSGAPNTKGTFTSVVMFGDSLSDGGTYTPAVRTPPAAGGLYFGGKFTNNTGLSTNLLLSNQSKVWVELLADSISTITTTPKLTPAMVGFGSTTVACPSAQLTTCTNYAQGGSRVTSPDGIGKSGGALTLPLKTQIANHLAKPNVNGSFKSSELILVFGGSNDVFTQAAYVSAKKAEAIAAGLTGDALNKKLFEEQLVAQHEIKVAAQELGQYVKNEILAKGGRYVAVMNLPNSALTPGGKAGGAESQFLLSGLVDNFNIWLREELTGQPVLWVDFNATFQDVVLNPAKYGMTNTSGMACDPVKLSALTGIDASQGGGGSLFCNTTTGVPAPPTGVNALTTGANPSTWLFADSVHPTTGGHQVIYNEVRKQLVAAGWL